jgi:molybdate transport system permease protein
MRDPLGRAPALLLVPAAIATALLVVPLVAMVAATDWAGLPAQLRSEPLREALWLSLTTASAAALICLVLGLPLAWVLARVNLPFRGALRALISVPLVLPPVVAGVALRTAFGRRGLLGQPILDATGFSFPFTTWGVVLSHVFVSLPFVVIAVEGAFRATGRDYDAAAATLGADRWTTFRRVTVPLALPGIVAGCFLVFIPAVGEFVIPDLLGGSSTLMIGRTLWLEFFQNRDWPAASAVAILLLLVLVVPIALFHRLQAERGVE